MKRVGPGSYVWRFTMAFTGVGSTMLGPFLPRLLGQWKLHDHQGGMLVACLFVGSFSGTLCLSSDLARCLRRGAWLATLGCVAFAWFSRSGNGFVPGMAALLTMGFGMGQLMSSLNLLVGSAPADIRARELANIGAAWCIGAVVSPLLTTVLFPHVSASMRLSLFGLLFLLPLFVKPIHSDASPVPTSEPQRWPGAGRSAALCALVFLLYGGIESSVGAWMPMYAGRYGASPLAAAQWVLSIFWLGLIGGRALTAAIVSSASEPLLLRSAILASSASLVALLASQSLSQIAVGTLVTGICLSPLFPLLLSSALASGYSSRTMGVMLACCALGSALLPLLIGAFSTLFSLRAAMFLVIAALGFVALLRWNAQQWTRVAA